MCFQGVMILYPIPAKLILYQKVAQAINLPVISRDSLHTQQTTLLSTMARQMSVCHFRRAVLFECTFPRVFSHFLGKNSLRLARQTDRPYIRVETMLNQPIYEKVTLQCSKAMWRHAPIQQNHFATLKMQLLRSII